MDKFFFFNINLFEGKMKLGMWDILEFCNYRLIILKCGVVLFFYISCKIDFLC